MIKLHHIRRDFVRQVSENDCGVACLAMILNYSGRRDEASRLHSSNNLLKPISMLQLKQAALNLNMSARCVEMDQDFLRNISSPCILHTLNESGHQHYIVCYGAVKKRGKYLYLVADPAMHAYYLPEADLQTLWRTKAAIYFGDQKKAESAIHQNQWATLLSSNLYPKGLFLSIPFVNLCSVVLGTAISWVLQKGINDSLTGKKNSLLIAIVLLLMIITVSRSVFTYIKQRILISLNNSINHQLTNRLILNLTGTSESASTSDLIAIKRNIAEIQKVQNAVSVFVSTILSDGSLIILLVSASVYTLPIQGAVCLVYIITMILLTIIRLPKLTFDYARLNQLAGLTENLLAREAETPIQSKEAFDQRIQFHQDNHSRYLKFARQIAHKMSKLNFIYECLGTICVITTFCIGLLKLQDLSLSYGEFMLLVIISYLITNLMPKITSSIIIISEGAEAFLQLKFIDSNLKA